MCRHVHNVGYFVPYGLFFHAIDNNELRLGFLQFFVYLG